MVYESICGPGMMYGYGTFGSSLFSIIYLLILIGILALIILGIIRLSRSECCDADKKV